MISIDDQIKCVERELIMRKRCYPRWIKEQRMSADEAAREINNMTAVLRTLSQVRIESLSVKEPDDKLREIETWAKAYPLTVFPEPDLQKAREVLQAAGMTLDAISASTMRYALSRVMEIMRK